eukprot:gene25412-11070_t
MALGRNKDAPEALDDLCKRLAMLGACAESLGRNKDTPVALDDLCKRLAMLGACGESLVASSL